MTTLINLLCRATFWFAVGLSFELQASHGPGPGSGPDWSAFENRRQTVTNVQEAKAVCHNEGFINLEKKLKGLNPDQQLLFSEIYRVNSSRYSVQRALAALTTRKMRKQSAVVRNYQPFLQDRKAPQDRKDPQVTMTSEDLERWNGLSDSAFQFLKNFEHPPGDQGVQARKNLKANLSFELLESIKSKSQREFMQTQIVLHYERSEIFGALAKCETKAQSEFFREVQELVAEDRRQFAVPGISLDEVKLFRLGQDVLLRLTAILPHISADDRAAKDLAWKLLGLEIDPDYVAGIFADRETREFATMLIEMGQSKYLAHIDRYRDNQPIREFFKGLELSGMDDALASSHLDFGFVHIHNSRHQEAAELLAKHGTHIMVPTPPAPGQPEGGAFFYPPGSGAAAADQLTGAQEQADSKQPMDEQHIDPRSSRAETSHPERNKSETNEKPERFIVLGAFHAIENQIQFQYLKACLEDEMSIDEAFLMEMSNKTQIDIVRILRSYQDISPDRARELALQASYVPLRVDDDAGKKDIREFVTGILTNYGHEFLGPVLGNLNSYLPMTTFPRRRKADALFSMLDRSRSAIDRKDKSQKQAALALTLKLLEIFCTLSDSDANLCLDKRPQCTKLKEWLELFDENKEYYARDRVRKYIRSDNPADLEPMDPEISRLNQFAPKNQPLSPEDAKWFLSEVKPKLRKNSPLHVGVTELFAKTRERSYFAWLDLDKQWQRSLPDLWPENINDFLLKLAQHPNFLENQDRLHAILDKVSSSDAWVAIASAYQGDKVDFTDDFFENLELFSHISGLRDIVIIVGLEMDRDRTPIQHQEILLSERRERIAKIAEKYGWADNLPYVILESLRRYLGKPPRPIPTTGDIQLPRGTHQQIAGFIGKLKKDQQRLVSTLLCGNNRLSHSYFFCGDPKCLWPLHETHGTRKRKKRGATTPECPECGTTWNPDSDREIAVGGTTEVRRDAAGSRDEALSEEELDGDSEGTIQTYIVDVDDPTPPCTQQVKEDGAADQGQVERRRGTGKFWSKVKRLGRKPLPVVGTNDEEVRHAPQKSPTPSAEPRRRPGWFKRSLGRPGRTGENEEPAADRSRNQQGGSPVTSAASTLV